MLRTNRIPTGVFATAEIHVSRRSIAVDMLRQVADQVESDDRNPNTADISISTECGYCRFILTPYWDD